MKKKEWMANFALLFCAAIWGLNMVLQKQATNYMGAFSFISIRYYVGMLSLIPLFLSIRKKHSALEKVPDGVYWRGKKFFLAAICASASNCAGALLIQIGLQTTDASKAGFIESAYIALVPLLQWIILRKKPSARVWIGIAMAMVGLYLLCISESIAINPSDIFIMGSTVCFALHILLWSIFSPHIDALKFVMVEFTCTGTISGTIALFKESLAFADVLNCLVPLLFAGILGVGVTYTIQIYAQRYTSASMAALLMSMEAVFGSIGGVIILNESLSAREWIGCLIMLITVIYVQFPKKEVPKKELLT